MAPRGSSSSAALVALARAQMAQVGFIDDPFAARMLPPRLRWAARILGRAGGQRSSLGRGRSFAYLAARTACFDQILRQGLDGGIDQVVILAAGYDTRAWRLARPGVRFFEVDLPATQEAKRRLAPSGGPTYVPADVTTPDLTPLLVDAGYDPRRPSVVTAEGLTMYLSELQVRALLRNLGAATTPGSRLGINFGVGFERRGSARGRVGRSLLAAGGEQFKFRPRPAETPPLLAAAGWSTVEVVEAPELGRRYLPGSPWSPRSLADAAGFVVAAVRASDDAGERSGSGGPGASP